MGVVANLWPGNDWPRAASRFVAKRFNRDQFWRGKDSTFQQIFTLVVRRFRNHNPDSKGRFQTKKRKWEMKHGWTDSYKGVVAAIAFFIHMEGLPERSYLSMLVWSDMWLSALSDDCQNIWFWRRSIVSPSVVWYCEIEQNALLLRCSSLLALPESSDGIAGNRFPLIRIPGYATKKIMKHDWMDFDRGVVTENVKNLIFWSVLLGQQSFGSKETRYNPLMHIWPRDDDCHGAEVFVTS